MKKFTLLIVLLVGGWTAGAQSLAPQVIAPSGGSGQSASADLSWTIGETMVATEFNSTNALTQGFQQPTLLVTLMREVSDAQMNLNVYPNPAFDQINIVYHAETFESVNYQMFDKTGKLLLENRINSKMTTVPVQTLAAGEYFLQVTGSSSKQFFKIQKLK